MSFMAMAWASKQKTGSPTKKLILLLLADRANDEGYCWPSIQSICSDCELSRDAVIRNIKRLEADGLLSVIRRKEDGVNLPNHYKLHLQGVVAQKDQGSSSERPGVVAQKDPNLSIEPINEPITPKSLSGEKPDGRGLEAELLVTHDKDMKYPLNVDAFNEFVEYRKASRHPNVSAHAAKRIILLLCKYPSDVQAEIVEKSIRNDYRGLFEPKAGGQDPMDALRPPKPFKDAVWDERRNRWVSRWA